MPLIQRLQAYLHAKYQSNAWLSWRSNPRSDVLAGLPRWRWMARQKRTGRVVDPSVEIRCGGELGARLDLGPRCALDRGVIVWLEGEHSHITLEEDVYVGPHVYLGSHQQLTIGAGSLIGAFCYLITCNHRFNRRDLPIREQGYEGGDILLGKDVWLGCHVVVLPGATIGDGAIVGAGAVVTKDIPPGQIWGGVPAKFLRER